uniref:Tetratricopeptide repeat domain protein n=1 Tax=uncultured Chloroflexota bacterium TaxID=166587 RepID=H5SQ40_9CHLR|nr:tetratricopeptide repeat domain protein [uncultured Chloroflexota bacterium]
MLPILPMKRSWFYDVCFLLVLLVAALLRSIGLNWDENQHLHPDERFLTMVETALQVKACRQPLPLEVCPADQQRWLTWREYFDTKTSPLNPHNRGYGFFVYGTLPVFIVRYLAEFLGQTGYDEVHLVGRQVSAIADLGTLLVLYLLANRLFNRKVALLAVAFSALAVMQIQQSHFFTNDTVLVFFMGLALYLASELALSTDEPGRPGAIRRPLLLSLGFGLALGMAMASKINAVALAVVLPLALWVRAARQVDADLPLPSRLGKGLLHLLEDGRVFLYLAGGAAFTLLAFRVFQPYAFDGLGLNPLWVNNLKELAAQSSGDADVPFALQWARRSHLFSGQNLTLWGLGLPLGLAAWAGFLYLFWHILRGRLEWLLFWAWTAFYFTWQSLAFNPTMRYQLPIYPWLEVMASWFLLEGLPSLLSRLPRLRRLVAPLTSLALLLVALGTFAWALAFVSIYTRPHTRVAATRWIYQNIPGPINLRLNTPQGLYQQPLAYEGMITPAEQFLPFIANVTGTLEEIYLPYVWGTTGNLLTLDFSLSPEPGTPPEQAAGRITLTGSFLPEKGRRGAEAHLKFPQPVVLEQGRTYYLRLWASEPLQVSGAYLINESSWDDGLPLRLERYDGFGGIYQGLNLELYWDDNPEKLARFVETLSQGDYILITSNRQWASIPRLPERYPLTTAYYRALIGCPLQREVIWCYNVARPGSFQGQLGYELVAVFESFPQLGRWRINDQFAEEAFTVYDHPKVLIFQKRADFDAAQVQRILGSVDLTQVVHLTPRQASRYKSLLLPAPLWQLQQEGGSWSELFSYTWLQNRYPWLGLLLWYAFLFLLGAISYPLVRLVLPGLEDRGYALGRTFGLVLFAWLAWMAGSAGLPITRGSLGLAFAFLTVLALVAAWFARQEVQAEIKAQWRHFARAEIVFLIFFLIDLLIRLGNPDLWHPAKGGERPMDFSYFNAILKSTVFPPYDPWYAGGYINYYYYGFVLVGMPVKLLGIVPSIAYNLILPSLFALVALSAFAIAWNLLEKQEGVARWAAAVAGSVLLVLLGNLGTIRLLYQGFQRLAAPGGVIEQASLFQRLGWAVSGFFKMLSGTPLPFGRGDWYWFPSRVIPAPGDVEPITEFPFFTFLYSDLHAHMIVLILTTFLLAWVVSLLRRGRVDWLLWLGGALVAGAIRPTNTWDMYTYLPLAMLAMLYVEVRRHFAARSPSLPQGAGGSGWEAAFLKPLLWAAGFYLLANLLYWPYLFWFGQAYGQVSLWKGSHTPIPSYLTHWGVFLFFLVLWLGDETRDWLASTPVSALRGLRPYQAWLELIGAMALAIWLYLLLSGVSVGWIVWPMLLWVGVLLFKPRLSDAQRLVLFLIGTALTLTLLVEIVVLVGDIGRMNTVFKLYLQAWTLLAVSAAAALGWLLPRLPSWSNFWRDLFQWGAVILLSGAALYTLTATADKIADRMAPQAPHTLDSMAYMRYAEYADFGTVLKLEEDYQAIRWLQDHVRGSPVIVEANCSEYRWCTRITIYTGLPGVIGWNWHQRQQRALWTGEWVTRRIDEVNAFYTTADAEAARSFLKTYGVRYILLGQLEQAAYPGEGLLKFEQYNGVYWRSVYRQGSTVIYEVLP